MRMRNRGIGQVTPNGATVIANTIQQVEGYIGPSAQYPNGTLAYQNNNPGNLIFVGQPGATQGVGGFAAWPTYQDGDNALISQIQNYASRGLTIDQMMAIYAPAGQGSNNPTAYAQQIADALGVSTDTTVAAAISGGSSGTAPTDNGVSTLSIDPTTGLMTIDDSGDSTGTGAGTSVGTGTGIDPTTALVAGALVLAALYLT